jgi:hypothetical protein
MIKNFGDRSFLQDGGDDFQGSDAMRTMLDIEHSLEQTRPTDAHRSHGRGHIVIPTGWVIFVFLAAREISERSLAFGASTPWKRMRLSLARETSAASRCMNSSGDITIGVVPSQKGVFSVNITCPSWLRAKRSSAIAGRVI